MAMVKIKVPIEVDVTQVNKTWFTGKKKLDNTKHYVIGFFQREAKSGARIMSLVNNKPETIKNMILEVVGTGAMIYCEENILPIELNEVYEIHELKPEDGHVRGDVHINNVKNMWRDLKRVIKRTHIQVSQKHIQLYCNEVAWRINHLHLTPHEKFDLLLSNCAVKDGKGTYKNLIK